MIPAPASSEQTYSALVHAGGDARRRDGRRDGGPLWIVDAGRLSARSPALPFATRRRPRRRRHRRLVPGAAAGPAPRRRPCARPAARVSVVVVEPTSWPTDEIADFVGADVVAVLPRVKAVASRRDRGDARQRLAAVVARTSSDAAGYLAAARPAGRPVGDAERGGAMSIADDPVTLEEVIEAVQEALVTAEAGRRVARLGRPRAGGVRPRRRHVVRRPPGPGRRSRPGATPMDVAAENDLIRRALAAYFHAGKFQALLDLDGVTDIMVNAHDAIWLQHVDGRIERYPHRVFADADDLRAEVAHLARRAGGTERRFDDAKPLLVLRLPDGSRLAAVMNVSTGAAGGDPPQRAARRLARRARGARHDRPGACTRCSTSAMARRDAHRHLR